MDLTDPAQLKEVYQLLTDNYVEDSDASFRFDYSAEFIRWALMPPGFIRDWHIGVRVTASRRLVAFISGIPMDLRIRQATKKCSEINYLCVHKKLRSKRLAPVLIKEVTRRCNLVGVFQAVYTVGQYLPTPVSASQYYHRALNTKKLVETGFSGVPRSTTLARLVMKNKVDDMPAIPGLREIEQRDAKEVGELLRAYLARFDMSPVMSDEEIQHNFFSGKGTGEVDPTTGWRQGQVTWSYVVEVSVCLVRTWCRALLRWRPLAARRTPIRTASRTFSPSTRSPRLRCEPNRSRPSTRHTSSTLLPRPVPIAALSCRRPARRPARQSQCGTGNPPTSARSSRRGSSCSSMTLLSLPTRSAASGLVAPAQAGED